MFVTINITEVLEFAAYKHESLLVDVDVFPPNINLIWR